MMPSQKTDIFRSEDYRIQLLAGILKQCDVLVSNDSSAIHVEAVIGYPVIVIKGLLMKNSSIYSRNQSNKKIY
ncbi:MAG: hypothetical protein M0Q48_10700 [Verrucomicrobia bacterium]|jgi:ADP-heptose:LPS heptosyltransferase|nr:hypothetical protein [Verrucomicrobiota bacterium]